MGRGRSKAGKGGGGIAKTTVVTQGGVTLDLSENPLVYGPKDPALSEGQRKAIEAQEKKRASAKIEYAYIVDENGNPIGGEIKGSRGKVKVPVMALNAGTTYTHNHPRGKGEASALGGTFSEADLNSFTKTKIKTYRASAAEGTYSITKTDKFKPHEFNEYQRKISKAAMDKHKAYSSEIKKQFFANKLSLKDANAKIIGSFNRSMVEVHNGLLSGQKQYGYTYVLEG